MIPDYFKFIRFQDRRIVPLFYFILFIVLGFYWKNNAFTLTTHDSWFVSGILAITLFNIIYELKPYWAYSCVIGRIDVNCFSGKGCSKVVVFFTRPMVVSVLSIFIFWLIVQCCLLLPSMIYSIICLFVVSPLFIYLVFRILRPIYIKQVLTSVSNKVKFKNLYWYIISYVLLTTVINILSISPLNANPDFSLTDGFFSAKLMVAMLILCVIVLIINLIFSRASKRYIFLGRFFLKEIDFFPKSVLFNVLYTKPFMIKMLLLLAVQFIWIMVASIILELLNWSVLFEVYFLICYLPCVFYYSLHLYWHWHNEFLMAYDMYFRYEEFKKRNT